LKGGRAIAVALAAAGALFALARAPSHAAGDATAGDPERSWRLVQEALLLEVLDGDLRAARARYEALVKSELPAGDPSLALAEYRLGEVCWLLEDDDAAREALDACIRAGVQKSRCLDLRSRIDLEADAVHEVPSSWTFADPHHGFLHPRAYWDRGSIRLVSDAERSELVWSTQVDGSQEDVLVVGFRAPTPAPRSFQIRLVSTQLDATLAFELEDLDGNRYTTPGRDPIFARGAPADLTVRLADLVGVDAGTPLLNPSRLHRLYVWDRTGRTAQTGPNELHIDQFDVR
jgi:hypothetical protein